MRSVERGICPIAALCAAFNAHKLTL